MCEMLKARLHRTHTLFDVETDMDTIMAVAQEHNCMSLPFAKINGQFYDTAQLAEYIKTLESER